MQRWKMVLFFRSCLGPQILAEEERLMARSTWAVRSRPTEPCDPAAICSQDSPSLLHGDLWSGNVLWDESGQRFSSTLQPTMDIVRLILHLVLFWGFPKDFFESYDKVLRTPGFEARLKVYMLYHLLNHVNIFGSAYLSQTTSMIENLMQEYLWGHRGSILRQEETRSSCLQELLWKFYPSILSVVSLWVTKGFRFFFPITYSRKLRRFYT